MANYRLEALKGVGPVRGGKLRAVGVKDTDSLLQACITPRQRAELAATAGVSPKRLLKWANMADLARISGVAAEFAELLEETGVDTIPELAQRNPANLAAAMQAANERRKLVRRVPSETEVAKWVEQAKQLPRVLQY